MNTVLKVSNEHVELYRMCVDFIASAKKLRDDGSISENEYIELTKLKKQFIEDNKHLERDK